jgi:hypothetical protein
MEKEHSAKKTAMEMVMVAGKKTTTKKASGGGGRRGSGEVLDLLPKREGGCEARNWNKGHGPQCSRKALPGKPYCNGCQKKADTVGLTCGNYAEYRPTFWHETGHVAISETKKKEDESGGMRWKMDDETYKRQYSAIFGGQRESQWTKKWSSDQLVIRDMTRPAKVLLTIQAHVRGYLARKIYE